jgi:hypothetical protein
MGVLFRLRKQEILGRSAIEPRRIFAENAKIMQHLRTVIQNKMTPVPESVAGTKAGGGRLISEAVSATSISSNPVPKPIVRAMVSMTAPINPTEVIVC